MWERVNELVRIRNLYKKYGSFSVLRGLSMDIEKGDVYGFLGRNGCGKTTTMNIITNIIPKDEGEIILGNGRPVKVGYLPESPTIYGYMTSREYLEYIAACTNYQGDVKRRVNEVLDIVGLTKAADRRAKGYSRGMTQRLGMGAAIIGDPELLIFDEPTSALDPEGRAEVISIIERLKSMGSTIVLSTHILSDVERVANRIGIMTNGRLAEEGYLTDILRKHGGDVIHLSVRGLTDDLKIKLLTVDYARAEFNDLNGQFRFGTDNAEETSRRLIQLLAENSAAVDTFSIGTASLEEVFRMVVGANAEAGFKKEWFQFSRTFRLWGILIATVSFSLADPLMYWAMNALLGGLTDTDMYGSIGGAVDIENSLGMLFGSAGSVFAGTMADLCATSLLIIMLILMSPCGGEQKKRATIIPSCSGLDTFSYLIPKYVMYPGTVFVTGFLAALISGGLCNLLFTDGKVSGGMVLLAAFLCAVYMAFFTAVYMSIGLFTSRPGVVTVFMYVGVSIVQMILMSLDLTKFHPLTLRSLVIGEMFRDDFVLADNAASIIVGIVLSVVIAVMMFVLTLSVIKSKKINNQEDKPEF